MIEAAVEMDDDALASLAVDTLAPMVAAWMLGAAARINYALLMAAAAPVYYGAREPQAEPPPEFKRVCVKCHATNGNGHRNESQRSGCQVEGS